MRRHLYDQPIEVKESIPEHPRALRLDLPEPPNGDASDQAFVYRLDDEVVGFFNRCGHVRLPMDLDDGKFFDREGMIICRVHGARFDERSGACIMGPAYTGLYRLLIQSGNRPAHDENSKDSSPTTPSEQSFYKSNTMAESSAVSTGELGSSGERAGEQAPNYRILGWEGPVASK